MCAVDNTATGYQALQANTSGNNNVATGDGALFGNTNGASNTASGHLLTHGSNNIDIGNQGVAGESGAIRIGTAGTNTETFVSGISGSKITGSAVYVTCL
jgi:hypothetical protein